MKDLFVSISEYNDILNRLEKRFNYYDGFYITIKQYFTNNTFYYFICLIFRLIPLILLSGHYSNIFNGSNNNLYSFQNYVKLLTCYNLVKYLQISYRFYIITNILIYISFSIREIVYILEFKEFKNYMHTNKWPLPNIYRIISDHFIFLLYPYIIEYLSFSYYILIFPNKFVINLNEKNSSLYGIIVINTFLIIQYNIIDYNYLICINRIYTTTLYEANQTIINENNKINNKPVKFRVSKFAFFIYIGFQNLVLFQTLENYLNVRQNMIFKLVISIIIIICILIIILSELYEYNYKNLINIAIKVIFLFCLYSIIFDFILFISKYSITGKLYDFFYMLLKLFISYITYLLLNIKSHKFFESKILEILFREKKIGKEINFINSFFYLNEIILKIKNNKDIHSVYLLVKFLLGHINNCNKVACNCNLLSTVLKKENFEKENEKLMTKYIDDLIFYLTYLFESIFIEYDYYNSYELSILLSEHFCHLKNNPTMAFSIINTFILKHKNKISDFEMITLYEISQKYIYFISANISKQREKEIIQNNNVLLNQQNEQYFKIHFNNSKISLETKTNMINYINNQIKILKYKNIFEESLKFNFDETNEVIISVYINFFDIISNIDDSFIHNGKKNSKNYTKSNKKNNLYIVINLIKKEQMYYNNIMVCLDKMKDIKNIPIIIIFKYCLFFDFFKDGKIPQELANKLNSNIGEKMNLYSNYLTINEYSFLKKIYNEQNCNFNSKYYAIYQFKKDLRTKYFSEACALKLGYNQKDIINEKIEKLMPKKFYESHQNMLKQLVIGNQLRYLTNNQGYLFDSSSSIIYPIKFQALLIYNMMKNLAIITESIFETQEEYIFMISNNYELLACSKNFEEEYFFNKKIFEAYDIKIMDIFQIKQEKLYKFFKKTFAKIDETKLIRKIKTEEYFIPSLYVQPGEKISGMMNPSNFINTKINYLTKISNSKVKNESANEELDEEDKKFINKEKNKKLLNDLLYLPVKIIFHDNFNISIEKNKFLENFSKELAKIPDNDLRFDNDKFNYNLIISGKELNKKLLKKKNIFINSFMRMKIKLSYYYDKPYYFILIEDDKKSFLSLTKGFNYQENNSINKGVIKNNNTNDNIFLSSSVRKISKDSKEDNHKTTDYKISKKNIIKKSEIENIDKIENDKNEILNKIEKYKQQINRDKFILIIKLLLYIIIICIFAIYISILVFQKFLIKRSESILLSYYYISQTRESFLNIHSLMLELYYYNFYLYTNDITNYNLQQRNLKQYYNILKDNYYNYSKYYLDYNIEIGHDFYLIYQKRLFNKIEGFWEEVQYQSIFGAELESIIFQMHSINTSLINSNTIYNDLSNFLFFSNKTQNHIKVESSFIQLLYYLCVNYENTYKYIFNEIQESIYKTFNNYIYSNMNYYHLLEIFGLFFYIILFISVLIYLYYSNQIIFKNIIFLFLDFSENLFNKNIVNTNNKIILKLLELKYIIDDFSLERLQRYSNNLDKLNKIKNKSFRLSSKNLSIGLNSSFETNNINESNASQSQANNAIMSKNRKISTKKIILLNKMERENKRVNSGKNLNKNGVNNDFRYNKLADIKNKGLNDSSQNYLVQSRADIMKDKLNNNDNDNSNSMDINNMGRQSNRDIINNMNNNFNEIISPRKNNNSQNNNKNNNVTVHKGNSKTIKDDEFELNDSYQDILLNKSNKTPVLFIRIYTLIIFLFIIIIIIFSAYKIKTTLKFKTLLNDYFIDFMPITNRYTLLTYYFNILRTMFIFPNDDRKKHMDEIMQKMSSVYNDENKKFVDIISFKIDAYKRTKELYDILQNKNNSTEHLKNDICSSNFPCEDYLDSKYNIFDVGVDFAFTTCITQINNIYMDYKKLNNIYNISEIKERITRANNSQFEYISASISNMFIYVQNKIFTTFLIDQFKFKGKYSSMMTMFNLVTVAFSILTFLFVNIIIFFSISNFSEPIKNSTYRINCSFYFIKKYSLAH